MKITITKLEAEDIASLVTMIKKDKSEQGRKISELQEVDIKSQLTELLECKNPLTLVAKDGVKIVGYINGHIIPFPLLMKKECYVSCLLVDSEQRGKSIGQKLIVELSRRAKELGCFRLMLNNPKSAESYSREFYTKNYFTERDNFANFVKVIED